MHAFWIRGSLVVGAVALAIPACSEAPEDSTIEVPEQGGGAGGSGGAPIMFTGDLEGADCCERYCEEAVGAGCRDYGDTKEACVINLCPVPGGLEPMAENACRQAYADAACCSWRQFGAESNSCTLVDGHGTAECGDVASEVDSACAVP